jgi:hypothetical protein
MRFRSKSDCEVFDVARQVSGYLIDPAFYAGKP